MAPQPSGNFVPMPMSPGFLRPFTQGFRAVSRYSSSSPPMAFSFVAGPGFLAGGVAPKPSRIHTGGEIFHIASTLRPSLLPPGTARRATQCGYLMAPNREMAKRGGGGRGVMAGRAGNAGGAIVLFGVLNLIIRPALYVSGEVRPFLPVLFAHIVPVWCDVR